MAGHRANAMNPKTEWWLKLPVKQPDRPPGEEPAQELSHEDEATRKWVARYLYLADFLLSTEESEELEIDESAAA